MAVAGLMVWPNCVISLNGAFLQDDNLKTKTKK